MLVPHLIFAYWQYGEAPAVQPNYRISPISRHEVLLQKMASLGQGSNPCMVLNSYHSGCKYELKSEKGPAHAKEFVMAVDVLGREYIGKGRSKKLAKQAAAANALNEMYNVRLTLGSQGPGVIVDHAL